MAYLLIVIKSMKTQKIKSYLFVLAAVQCLTFVGAANSYAAPSYLSFQSYAQRGLNSDISVPRNELHQQLEQLLKSPQTSVQQIKSLIATGPFKGQASAASFEIMNEMQKHLKISDIFDVFQKFPDASSLIMRYIDPQDDGEPIWKSVNRKLRTAEAMTPDQIQFTQDLTKALETLPSVNVISYRGAALQQKYFDLYQEGQTYVDKAFSSTSLDPDIAVGFSESSSTPDTWSTIFIIYGKTGRYISLFKPENIHEHEILFKPSTPFKVIRKIQDIQKRSAIIVLQE